MRGVLHSVEYDVDLLPRTPYGNLIDVPFANPGARTHVKDNLFSFPMPWEDIQQCCREASQHGDEIRVIG